MAENHLGDEALPKAPVKRAQLLAEAESKADRLLHGSILSRVGVSSKPGAIHKKNGMCAHRLSPRLCMMLTWTWIMRLNNCY
ncbi:MAG: hypothetical protein HC889_07310 [Synechococcaceae cyanobacterium SM1_2_3]|nr:hypothetical protein [Synechococcaceae cyanobacterium SM1_2_3]